MSTAQLDLPTTGEPTEASSNIPDADIFVITDNISIDNRLGTMIYLAVGDQAIATAQARLAEIDDELRLRRHEKPHGFGTGADNWARLILSLAAERIRVEGRLRAWGSDPGRQAPADPALEVLAELIGAFTATYGPATIDEINIAFSGRLAQIDRRTAAIVDELETLIRQIGTGQFGIQMEMTKQVSIDGKMAIVPTGQVVGLVGQAIIGHVFRPTNDHMYPGEAVRREVPRTAASVELRILELLRERERLAETTSRIVAAQQRFPDAFRLAAESAIRELGGAERIAEELVNCEPGQWIANDGELEDLSRRIASTETRIRELAALHDWDSGTLGRELAESTGELRAQRTQRLAEYDSVHARARAASIASEARRIATAPGDIGTWKAIANRLPEGGTTRDRWLKIPADALRDAGPIALGEALVPGLHHYAEIIGIEL